MINRSTYSQALAAESPDLDPLGRPLQGVTWRAALKWFQLPTTLQGYLIFLLCLLILAFTMVLHVTLSAEILRLNTALGTLEAEHTQIERQNANTVWLIAQRSSLDDAHDAALEMKYTANNEVRFVVRTGEESVEANGEPILSHTGALEPLRPPWWQRAWQRTQSAVGGALAWLRERTGW